MEAGDEGSGVGERDEEVDEFALERLGMACAVKKCKDDFDQVRSILNFNVTYHKNQSPEFPLDRRV